MEAWHVPIGLVHSETRTGIYAKGDVARQRPCGAWDGCRQDRCARSRRELLCTGSGWCVAVSLSVLSVLFNVSVCRRGRAQAHCHYAASNLTGIPYIVGECDKYITSLSLGSNSIERIPILSRLDFQFLHTLSIPRNQLRCVMRNGVRVIESTGWCATECRQPTGRSAKSECSTIFAR